MTQDLFTKPVSEIFSLSDIIAVYLFGSQAMHQSRNDSDYDIAIFVKNRETIDSRKLIEKIITQFAFPEKLHLSIVDLYNSSPLLMYEIIKSGTLLYEKIHNSQVNMQANILKLYFDDQHRTAIFYSYLEQKYAHR